MSRLEVTTEQERVLAKAVMNVATQLNLSSIQLAEILGLDPASITQPEALPELDPHTETGQRAMYLVQIFKRLFAMTGGDAVWMQQFMHTRNQVSNGIPVKQMKRLDGMKNILAFLNMQ
ncbi:antitoxin Xre-like helix-turn-helix domain-containing protein [Acinetobacter sp. MB5]|uniref:antitoxin Xre-like helix-turn-helix domain-containing protein n=1 Tax=Acinetobacter sp. MB5 TaxID=2069438 RepID=UPI000DCFE5DC|nr:antitoxin Xre-like helix-turn-helix domain-containing protein [Acinetobacter sp. MB5]